MSERRAKTLGCVRVELTKPEGRYWQTGEVGRRIYRAWSGMPDHAVLQLIVAADTPDYDPQVPPGPQVQIVASDWTTLSRWLDLVPGAFA